MRIDVAIPAHNEERIIGESVAETAAALASFPLPARILVADNASTDATGERAAAAGATVISAPRKGKGAALIAAARASDAEYFAFLDADLSAHPREFVSLYRALTEAKADIAIGSRLMDEGAVHRSWFRTFTSQVFNMLRHAILGIAVADTQCGLKLMSGKGRELLASCHEEGWFLDMELLARAERAGLAIVEVPISWEEFRFEGRESKLRVLRDGIGAVFAMVRIRRRLG